MKKNALIVDDSRLACKVMANMLETMGIDSVSVYSAEEALEYLKNKQPDVLFLDHTMPGMDGLETIKLIKSNPLTATIPVLMYTAKQGEVYVGQARALGAVDVLPKGMEKDYLVKALSKLGFISNENITEPAQSDDSEKIIIEREIPEPEHYQSTTVDEPVWQSFWQKQAEPFLHRQKEQHLKDIKYSSRLQTLKLTREIHQTLEQFEHALVARIESNDDYKQSNQIIANKQSQRKIIAVGALVVILQMGIFWQLYESNRLNEQQLIIQSQQQDWKNQLDNQLSQLNQKIDLIQSVPETVVERSVEPIRQIVSLVDDLGDIVADNLYLTDPDKNEYSGVTTSGYQFIVNTSGEVGTPLQNQYFLTDDCNGDAWDEQVRLRSSE